MLEACADAFSPWAWTYAPATPLPRSEDYLIVSSEVLTPRRRPQATHLKIESRWSCLQGVAGPAPVRRHGAQHLPELFQEGSGEENNLIEVCLKQPVPPVQQMQFGIGQIA